jgi:hypothetical protein
LFRPQKIPASPRGAVDKASRRLSLLTSTSLSIDEAGSSIRPSIRSFILFVRRLPNLHASTPDNHDYARSFAIVRIPQHLTKTLLRFCLCGSAPSQLQAPRVFTRLVAIHSPFATPTSETSRLTGTNRDKQVLFKTGQLDLLLKHSYIPTRLRSGSAGLGANNNIAIYKKS